MVLNIGDKFRVVRTDLDFKEKYIGKEFTVRKINPNGNCDELHYGVVEPCMFVFFNNEIEPVATSPTSSIKRVIYNNPATIILWNDGTKTIAKCEEGDTYDREKGFVIAYLKKMIGNTTFRDELTKWCDVFDEVKEVKEVSIANFKVGDRVAWGVHKGTVICIKGYGIGDIGVEFDDANFGIHNCKGFDLIAGAYGTRMSSRWCCPKDLKHINEPLTIEQLMNMDGQEVWLSSMDCGVEHFNDEHCGWYTVDTKSETLRQVSSKSKYYDFCNINDDYGFRAYREPPIKK